jgi:enoyl-CoA hydratase
LYELTSLRWEVDDTVATLWMDRPPVNAFDQEMYVELKHFFDNITSIVPTARAVVITGAGRHFCAGNDLAEFPTITPENSPGRMKNIRDAYASIYDAPVPVIAAVGGAALGTGLCIAACADLIVAADDARFGLPEVNVGVMGGSRHAARLVPHQWVRYLHLTGEPLGAEEVHRLGGVLSVVPRERLLDEARALAAKVARHSPVALRFAKTALNHIEFSDIRSGYEYEQGLTGQMSGYADAKEAVAAFLEQRPPVYTGY